MNIFVYDKTFEGLLTLVFDSYEIKRKPDKIIDQQHRHSFLFSNIHEVITDEERAERVWKGLQQRLEKHTCQMLYHVYLTEEAGVELLLYQYMCKAFDSNHNIENDFSDISVIDVVKLGHKISREAQRMVMFVRFQKTIDDIFFSSFDPKYNVLPLMVHHFEKRFADQKWIVYDTRRKYGFYYDLKKLCEVRIENMNVSSSSGKLNDAVISVDEKLFQELWKTYFKELSIKERANYKLHVQHLPKRFWKYLTEKQI